jgi:hypothetical protein
MQPPIFDELNEENFILFAAKNYDNPQCIDAEEFYEDIARFKYLKRLFRKYQTSQVLQERLILNHLVVLGNVFNVSAATKMLFYKIDEKHWSYLKPFLLFLRFIGESDYVNVPLDKHIVDKLREI